MKARNKYKEYLIFWRDRLQKERKTSEQQREVLRRIALECAQILGVKYKVSKVYLIGSLVRKDVFHKNSDIDLVVEGLKTPFYLPALTDIWRKLPYGVEMDLIPLEDAFDEIKERVVSEGELLYARK